MCVTVSTLPNILVPEFIVFKKLVNTSLFCFTYIFFSPGQEKKFILQPVHILPAKAKHLYIKEIFLKFCRYTDTWIGNTLLETAKPPTTVSVCMGNLIISHWLEIKQIYRLNPAFKLNQINFLKEMLWVLYSALELLYLLVNSHTMKFYTQSSFLFSFIVSENCYP